MNNQKINEMAEVVLTTARSLIEIPNKWVKGVEALDARGQACLGKAPAACRYCLIGAVNAFEHMPRGVGKSIKAGYGIDRAKTAVALSICEGPTTPEFRKLTDVDPNSCDPEELLPVYNDYKDTTHADVLLVLNHAIDMCRQKDFRG